jgi:uncharacterized BrkB/YihY/UPF0761 family membrane protein
MGNDDSTKTNIKSIADSSRALKARGKRKKRTNNEQFDQVVLGISIFNREAGLIYSASATFSVIICFFPMLLMLTSFLGKITGSKLSAFNNLFETLKGVFPGFSPWINQNLSHLATNADLDFFNKSSLLMLTIGFVGLVQSMQKGIQKFSEHKKYEPRKELLQMILGSFSVLTFLIILTATNHSPTGFVNLFFTLDPNGSLYYVIDQYPLTLPCIISLMFFTFFFRFLIPFKVRVTDGLMGAVIFTGIFLVLKTGSWLYMHYFQKDFEVLFGIFTPVIMATMWTFLIITCMFISASITLSPGHRRAAISSAATQATSKSLKTKKSKVKKSRAS